MKSPANRAERLKSQIEDHRYSYYVLEDPTISDGAYDSLVKELEELETDYPELKEANSPTQRVGAEPLDRFDQVEHSLPMLSLHDVFSFAELESWYEKTAKQLEEEPSLHLDIKMDGLAAALIYEDGELVQAATRGNGRVGEDITQNIRTIGSVPLRLRVSEGLDVRQRLEVRGEVIIYKDDFNIVNKDRGAQGLQLYANPRNLAAGSVRQLDPKLAAQRPLQFHAYRVIATEKIASLSDEYQIASQIGFIVNQAHKRVSSLKEAQDYIEYWGQNRGDLPYNTDGVVVSVDNRQDHDSLGVVGKAPRGAVAYKYPAEQASTKIKDIQVNVGRTGAVTPFAVLKPVQIAGTTVQMATLHNIGEIDRKDVRIGDTVIVQKAGDIIPEVVESLPSLRSGDEVSFQMPQNCPVCESSLIKKDDEAVWRCPNETCPARSHRQIEHFVSKGGFDIEFLGEKLVKQLLDEGVIRDAADLFAISSEDLEGLEGLGLKSAEKLVDSIASSKTVPLDRFIFALGIRHVGQQTAQDLAHQFGSLDRLAEAKIEDLEQVEGIGQVAAKSVVEWFDNEVNKQLLNKLEAAGVEWQAPAGRSEELEGKTFVVTGTLSDMSRSEISEYIENRGGKVTSNVSSKTDYVVAGINPGSSKLEQAKKHGVDVIDEEGLRAIAS